MLVEFKEWRDRFNEFSIDNRGIMEVVKQVSHGSEGNWYTVNLKIGYEDVFVNLSQGGGGTKYEIALSYIKLEYKSKQFCNFDISLYQKGFLERIFSSGRMNSGNRLFDKKFGIYSSNKHIAFNLFNNKRVQDLFLNNKFLIFNMQKDNSSVVLKSMETKLYEEDELQELLDSFIYIVNIINRKND